MQCCTQASEPPGRARLAGHPSGVLCSLDLLSLQSALVMVLLCSRQSPVAWTRDLLWEIHRERSYLLRVRNAVLPSDRHAINRLQEVRFK